ncbi:hypothetical protein AB0M43_11115 [Longispora sp. NPDC051575]|uniref:hypothetical protein n=1 Tax=Longispora sp. NPDC051575 TaxID=3154943 RepID=UPI0034286AE9
MAKPGNDPLDAALRDGWLSACRLYEHLARGGEPLALPPSALRMQPDEVRYGDAVLGYARLYGMSVTYNQSNSFWFGSASFVAMGMAADAIGNSSARRKAEAMAAVQWRDQAHVRTSLTSQRFLCDYQGQWLSFWHNGVVEFACDLARWSFVLRYEVGEPLMLHGPAAPWFAVLAARVVYGPQGVLLPAFAPLAAAVAERQRAITGEIVPPA